MATTPATPPVTTLTIIPRGPLHLLGAPAGVRLAHVGRRLDGGDKLEGDVADADDADDGAGDDAEDVVVEQDAADKDVDCVRAKRDEKGPVSYQLTVSSLGNGASQGWVGKGTYRCHGRGTRTGTRRSARPAAGSGTLSTRRVTVSIRVSLSNVAPPCGMASTREGRLSVSYQAGRSLSNTQKHVSNTLHRRGRGNRTEPAGKTHPTQR